MLTAIVLIFAVLSDIMLLVLILSVVMSNVVSSLVVKHWSKMRTRKSER